MTPLDDSIEIRLASVRTLFLNARELYASAQHRFSNNQRRHFRARLTSLRQLVERAEQEHSQQVQCAVTAKVSRALEHAPALAYASLASIHRFRTPPRP